MTEQAKPSEIVSQELAARVSSLGTRLQRYPASMEEFTPNSNKPSIALMTHTWSLASSEKTTVLYSPSGWIPTNIGSGGIVFEANIEPYRREEIKKLGIDSPHLIGIGTHTEEKSRDLALVLVAMDERYLGMFETTYYIDNQGTIVKLSIVPTALDLRPDILGMQAPFKRIRSAVTSTDLQLIDDTLNIFEGLPLRK